MNYYIGRSENIPVVHVECCGLCEGFGRDYFNLCQAMSKNSPSFPCIIQCEKGRSGSFEVTINKKLIYSKLKAKEPPNYDELAQVVWEVSNGKEPRKIYVEKQEYNCVIS